MSFVRAKGPRAPVPKNRPATYRSTGPDQETLRVLIARSMRDGQPCCEGCNVALHGVRAWDWSVQHRAPRGMGGSRRVEVNSLANLMVLCGSATTPGSCHLRAESRRAEALEMGWLVPMGVDPLTVAVLIDRESRWVYLGIDGEYYDQPQVGVA